MPDDTTTDPFEIDPYWQDTLQAAIDRIMGIEAPDPFMGQFTSATGIGPGQIGDYITKMFTGAGAARKAGEFEIRGLADVNRLATQMFERERLRSAATGGRGSSAAAALKARGAESLLGARSDVRGKAAELEEGLRSTMFQRGAGALGAWEGAVRGDEAAVGEYGNLMLGATNPLLGMNALQIQQVMAWINQMFQERMWEGSVPPEE